MTPATTWRAVSMWGEPHHQDFFTPALQVEEITFLLSVAKRAVGSFTMPHRWGPHSKSSSKENQWLLPSHSSSGSKSVFGSAGGKALLPPTGKHTPCPGVGRPASVSLCREGEAEKSLPGPELTQGQPENSHSSTNKPTCLLRREGRALSELLHDVQSSSFQAVL